MCSLFWHRATGLPDAATSSSQTLLSTGMQEQLFISSCQNSSIAGNFEMSFCLYSYWLWKYICECYLIKILCYLRYFVNFVQVKSLNTRASGGYFSCPLFMSWTLGGVSCWRCTGFFWLHPRREGEREGNGVHFTMHITLHFTLRPHPRSLEGRGKRKWGERNNIRRSLQMKEMCEVRMMKEYKMGGTLYMHARHSAPLQIFS